MPFPSTGTEFMTKAFLSVGGEDITLHDGSKIKAIVQGNTFEEEIADEVETRGTLVAYVAANLKGTLAEDENVIVRGKSRLVLSAVEDFEGWLEVKLSHPNR